MSTVHVTVTQADIDAGCPSDQWRCPVAAALTRALGFQAHVDVVANWRAATAYWRRSPDDGWEQLQLPSAVGDWIHLFDTKGPRHVGGPIEFDLEVSAVAA